MHPAFVFFRLVKGFPSFTWDCGKSRRPRQRRRGADALKLNSVRVIRQKMEGGGQAAARWFILSRSPVLVASNYEYLSRSRLILQESIVFYTGLHLVERLSKSKGMLGRLRRGRLSHLNV